LKRNQETIKVVTTPKIKQYCQLTVTLKFWIHQRTIRCFKWLIDRLC